MKNRASFFIFMVIAIFGLNLVNAPSYATKPKTSSGKVCTIVGTPKADKLVGTSKADIICGLGGNDVIISKAGNDIVDGGTGNDTVSAGDGNDQVLGGSGLDSIVGGKGNDTLNAESGNDQINGDAGQDTLKGGTGNDVLNGGTGKDSYDGGSGQNTCAIETDEIKPFTCQLLDKLNYLFTRVTGRVIDSKGVFSKCGIVLFENVKYVNRQNVIAGGQLDSNGNFSFDAPKGTFKYEIGLVETIFNLGGDSNCQKFPQDVTGSQAKITGVVEFTGAETSFVISVPALVRTNLHVVNKDREPISGAAFEIQSHTPANAQSNLGTANVFSNPHLLFAVSQLQTDENGLLSGEVFPGQTITLRAKISIFGVQFFTQWQTIDTTSLREFEFEFSE